MSVKDPLGLKKRKKKKTEFFEPKWKSNIEQMELCFVIKTDSIRFNRVGKYFIKFQLVESFTDNYDGVSLIIDGEERQVHEFQSEILDSSTEEVGVRIPFAHTLSFNLPKG